MLEELVHQIVVAVGSVAMKRAIPVSSYAILERVKKGDDNDAPDMIQRNGPLVTANRFAA